MPGPDVPATALEEVRARGHIGIRLGLTRMRALLERLGKPQDQLRGVLIGGTNGKGSTQAMVAAMLRAGGYSTLQAPSPHLSSYRERIIVDGLAVPSEDLEEVLGQALAASDEGERVHGPATQYELLIAAAFLQGKRRKVEVAVMEVGLGGRLDATNMWDGGVAAITNVGLDHQEYLGDTIEEVAAEKAAIIKVGDRAVTGATGVALRVISDRCAALGVVLSRSETPALEGMDTSGITVHDSRLGRLHIPLVGRVQAKNASVALATMAALDATGIATVADDALRAGLADVRWPGRMELIEVDGITVLLDGAHNPDGAAVLAATIDELRPLLPAGRATLLLGVLRDKEVEPMLRSLARAPMLADAQLVTTSVPGTDRATSAAELAAGWSRVAGAEHAVIAIDDADVALGQASQTARKAGGLLVVAGSLYLVGHARALLLPNEHLD